MNIYEIDKAITSLIDNETGEISDFEAFEQLQLDRETKIENIALAYKNYNAEAIMIKDEAGRLMERAEKAKSNAERCKKLLEYALQGQAFKTPKTSISYRKSTSVKLEDEFLSWALYTGNDNYVNYKDPVPNLTAIKNALRFGEKIPHAELVENNNIQVR